MTTPRDIRISVADIKSRGYDQLTQADYERLCHLAVVSLPMQSERRGKDCPHCLNKIGNASKICVHCKKRVSKHATFVRPPDGVNDCTGECASDLTGRDDFVTLSCGHKFCCQCIGNRVRRKYVTCCNCDAVYIPETILKKYLPAVV